MPGWSGQAPFSPCILRNPATPRAMASSIFSCSTARAIVGQRSARTRTAIPSELLITMSPNCRPEPCVPPAASRSFKKEINSATLLLVLVVNDQLQLVELLDLNCQFLGEV